MAYLNLDDNYPDHPKVEGLSDRAYRLHGAAMFFSAKWLLDGRLTPKQMRDRKRYSPVVLRELIDADLIHNLGQGCGTKTCPTGDPGSYLLHDYWQWNKSRAWWETKRIKDAERLAEWRAKHPENKGGTK